MSNELSTMYTDTNNLKESMLETDNVIYESTHIRVVWTSALVDI